MSRSRKDDSRYQSPSGPGLQSSPSRDPNSSSGAFHSHVVSGHNYMRSKVKDRDRSGYLAKDRVRTTNTVDANERYFAPARQGNFQSPPQNSFPCTDGASSSRELSWADEVELSMSNNSSQRTDSNTGGTTAKTMKSPERGQAIKSLEQSLMMKSLEQGAGEPKSATQSSNANQRPVDEKAAKMLPKNPVAQPTAAFSNGKAKVNFDKEHDSASFKRANCPQLRRGSRKKTLSLNPEEREALESLIEEVLMDGVIDSESASSEEETEQSETWKNANAELSGTGANVGGAGGEGMLKARGDKGKMGRKYYPGQLKVALKHMTELPPRFSRKLKKAEKYLELNTMRGANSTMTGRIEEEDEESLALARDDKRLSLSPRPPERDKEKAKSKEHQVKEFKRSIRTLLTDLDQYVDEKSVLSNSSSATSIHPPGAIICEDLERESLRQPLQSAEPTHEVPSTVQNLLLAAKGYTSIASNQAGATQETFQEQYQENESSVSSGSNLAGFSGAELASQRYTSPYTVQDSTAGGSQFMVNVPEFVPKGAVATTYQPQEMLSPAEHHQYQTSMMTQLSPGSMSGNLNDPRSNRGMTAAEQMMAMAQGFPLTNASSAATDTMSSGMMDFSNSLMSMPPTLGTQGSSMSDNRMMSPMPPVFVSSGMPLSNLPSPGGLPFYQFQTQNPPPPSSSYSFPVQVPFSSNQYCYMPPALPPQSLPPPYYPRDHVQYADGGMQFKATVPDWGYQKPKHYSNNVSTLPTYSAFPNQTAVLPSYPGSEQGMPGMNNLNFRQRKKQPASSLSPRNMANTLSNMSAGKLAMQRTRCNEGPSAALTRVGFRPGQENTDSYSHPEASMTVPAYGDASLKRFPFTVRSRVSGDSQLGYQGRRENRNFVSDKYAIPRTFTNDGKKEARHVTLKPKQSKPNRSVARSRNDPNVAQLHPVKAHHPSDLSEEGLESPDNFGDVESGADDWSTDNYDQEVSKKGKEEAVEFKGDSKDPHNANEGNVVPSTVLSSCAAEEVLAVQPVETTLDVIPDDTCISENVLSVSSECVAENVDAEVISFVKNTVPECILELTVSEPVPEAGSTADVVEHSSPDVKSEESRATLVTETPPLQLEIDRFILHTENLRMTAVRKKVQASLEDLEANSDVASVHLSLPLVRMAEPDAERDDPTAVGGSSVNGVCESLPELSVIVATEVVIGQLSEESLTADIDVPGEAVDEDGCGSESVKGGMDVMLGSNFVSRLTNMFEPITDSICKRSPKSVHLSQVVLNQIYLEYVTQDQNSDDLQNVMSGLLEEEVSNGPLVEVPAECVTLSQSVDERTLDAVTERSTQQLQLCDTSCHHDSDSNDFKPEDAVLNNNIISSSSQATEPAASP